jgi:hypothetical protein
VIDNTSLSIGDTVAEFERLITAHRPSRP